MYHLQNGHGQGGHETRVLKALVTPINIRCVKQCADSGLDMVNVVENMHWNWGGAKI